MIWDRVLIGADDECWPWTGAISQGYGQAMFGGKKWQVHRVAYMEATGEEPMVVDHTCHNLDLSCMGGPTCLHRRCCNPAHLTPTTNRDYLLASTLTLAGKQSRQTHCKRNHPLSGDNLYVWHRMRHCKECDRERHRKRGAEQR